jgi:hypothetical protein
MASQDPAETYDNYSDATRYRKTGELMEVAFQPVFIEGQHDGSSKHAIERRPGFDARNEPNQLLSDLQGGGVMPGSWKRYLEDRKRKRREMEEELERRGWKQAKLVYPSGFTSSSVHGRLATSTLPIADSTHQTNTAMHTNLRMQAQQQQQQQLGSGVGVTDNNNDEEHAGNGSSQLNNAVQSLGQALSSASSSSVSAASVSAAPPSSVSTPTAASSKPATKSKGGRSSAAAKALGIMGLSSTLIENSGVGGSDSRTPAGAGAMSSSSNGGGADPGSSDGNGGNGGSGGGGGGSGSIRASLLSAAAAANAQSSSDNSS